VLTGIVLAAIATPASAGGASCVISTTALAFGRYIPSRNAPADFTASLTLTCVATGAGSAIVEGTISLIGSNSDRELSRGPHRLRYQLFADPARTIRWGDGGSGKAVSVLVGPTTPLRASYTIYGRILGRQRNAQVGNYTDQVTAVLDY
jgi:spore coat protein U-like protein